MQPVIPSSQEQIALKQPLQQEIVDLFCKHGPGGWKMPTLELRANMRHGFTKIELSARAFDMAGTGEVAGAPEEIMRVAATYHALCNSFGQGWNKCLLTLTLGEKGVVKCRNWSYTYP